MLITERISHRRDVAIGSRRLQPVWCFRKTCTFPIARRRGRQPRFPGNAPCAACSSLSRNFGYNTQSEAAVFSQCGVSEEPTPFRLRVDAAVSRVFRGTHLGACTSFVEELRKQYKIGSRRLQLVWCFRKSCTFPIARRRGRQPRFPGNAPCGACTSLSRNFGNTTQAVSALASSYQPLQRRPVVIVYVISEGAPAAS